MRNASDKILTVEQLGDVRRRHPGARIVLCHGAFDLVHMGHLLHFEEARALGDLLVVTVTGDRHITKKRAVSLNERYRAHQVASLEVVDFTAVIDEPSAVTAIDRLRPDVYVKGPEYVDLMLDKTSNIAREKTLVESYGGKIHFTAGETFSSTKLSHFLLSSSEAEQQDNPLLRNERNLFRDASSYAYSLEEVKRFMAEAAGVRVCVIGETIIDEWVDIAVSNLSQKSRCIAGLETKRISQIGGSGIIALHLAAFAKEVHCFTTGLPGAVPANVRLTHLSDQTLIKTRYVDRDLGYPMFESKRLEIGPVRHDRLPSFDDYDLVLIADFGHGLLDPQLLNQRIAGRRRAFVAAMVQVNSSNYGYNLPIKYAGGDYYSLNRTEAELCLHERGLPLPELVGRVSRLLGCDAVSVTDGAKGMIVKKGDDTFALPTLSASVKDTIGCGDAYFALSSLAARLGLPARMLALTGGIGAAAMAQRYCNESPITDQEFLTIAKIVI